MPLTTTYLNERIELFEGVYDSERHNQIRAVTQLYNRLLGPVTGVQLFRPELLDFSIYSAACSHVSVASLMRDISLRQGPYAQALPGGGKGGTMLTAVLGALGEMAERLLGVLQFEPLLEEIKYGTYEDLIKEGSNALAPEEMPLFAPEQYSQPKFRYVPFRADTFLGWIRGTELLSGDPKWVPAQLCLLYYKCHPEETRIGYATSGGLAFHTSRRAAILHGIYELSERDGINVHWYARIQPAHVAIDVREFPARYLRIRRARMSTPYTADVEILLNTLDIPVPIFAAIAIDKSREGRAFIGGGGAASRREQALAQALFELGQSQSAFRYDDPFGRNPIAADAEISHLTDFFDAPLYYGHANNLGRTAWYSNGERTISWDNVPTLRFNSEEEEYDATVEWLEAAGLEPIVLDFGESCWPGVALTKVLIPQLTQPSSPSLPVLGHPRFYELPKQLGLMDRTLKFGDLNKDPVPLP